MPAFIEFEGEKYNARLINLAPGGALIEAVIPLLPVNSTAALHCGTIMGRASVVWTKDRQLGLKFEASLTEAQVNEQLLRTFAIAARRESRPPSGTSA